MSKRKGLIGAAVCAALATSAGLARAQDEGSSRTTPGEAQPRTPLMELLKATPLEKAGISVTGRVEGGFTYGANSPLDNTLTGRVFDSEHEDLTLNQAAIVIGRTVDTSKFDVGGKMEWIYGADARFIHSLGLFDHLTGDGPENQWDLNQLYVDVSFGGGWSARVGKFVALHGYETIDPTGNPLYSHSFLFDYAIPFTHTGVLVSHVVSPNLDYTFGVTRGWDTSLEDDNGTVDFLGQIHWKNEAGDTEAYLNVVTGADQPGDNDNWRTVVDLIVKRQLSKQLTLVINADYGYEANSAATAEGSDAQWYGAAVYAINQVSPMLAVVARGEYFYDGDGARLTGAVGGTGLYEATLGLNITPFPNDAIGKGLVIRPEIRADYSDKRFYDGGTDRFQLTAAIDAVFRF